MIKQLLVVSKNTQKSVVSFDQRYQLVEDAVKDIKNVDVKLMETDLTINMVHELNSDVIVRRARNSQDFVYEQQIA